MRADGADETVPAVGDGGVVEEGEVEGDKGAGVAAGGYALVYWGRGGVGSFLWGVRDAHFWGCCGCGCG